MDKPTLAETIRMNASHQASVERDVKRTYRRRIHDLSEQVARLEQSSAAWRETALARAEDVADLLGEVAVWRSSDPLRLACALIVRHRAASTGVAFVVGMMVGWLLGVWLTAL